MLTKAESLEASLSSLAFGWQQIFPPPVSSGPYLVLLWRSGSEQCPVLSLGLFGCQSSLRSSDKQQILAFDTWRLKT